MTARCGAAASCRGAATVRQLSYTRRVVGIDCVDRTDSCSCSCMRGCGRKLVAIQTEARPTVRSTQPADALHALCAIHTVSHHGSELDASAMARNVCRDLVFTLLHQAVTLRTRILTWAAAPTAMQKHCPHGRPHHFVAGTRRCLCLDCHEFSSTPLRFRPHPRMQLQLSFRPHPRKQMQLHELCAIHAASNCPPLVCGNCLTVAAQLHGAAA